MTSRPDSSTQPDSGKSLRSPHEVTSPAGSEGSTSLWSGAVFVVVAVAATMAAFPAPRTASAGQTRRQLPPKILVLRGVFEVFSLGMNDLAHKLQCLGYDAKVTSWTLALVEAECADPRPIVVVGHSLGGRMCGWVPRKLRNCGRQVPLVIVVDANLLQEIPSNVDRCVNLYVTNPFGIFHGSPVRPESPHTEVVNWDVSRGQPPAIQGGVNHFNIDATDWVHQIIIHEIGRTFPAPLARKSLRRAHQTQIADRRRSGTAPLPKHRVSTSRVAFGPDAKRATVAGSYQPNKSGHSLVQQVERPRADPGGFEQYRSNPPRIRLPKPVPGAGRPSSIAQDRQGRTTRY